jgi:O-antigen ligase
MSINIAGDFAPRKKAKFIHGKALIDTSLFLIMTAILFPVLGGADSWMYEQGYLRIPYPSFFLLLIVLIPLLLKNLTKDKGLGILRVYQNTTRISVPFGLVAFIAIVWGLHPDAEWADNGRKIFFNAYHVALLVFGIGLGISSIIQKHHRTIFLITLLGTATAIWIDYFNPGTFSDIANRAAGFSSNANDGARAVIVLCIGSVNWEKRGGKNLLIFTFSLLTVFTTLSASNLLLFCSVAGYYFLSESNGGKKGQLLKRLSLLVAIPLLVVFVVQPLMGHMIESGGIFKGREAQKRIGQISNLFKGDTNFLEDHERANLVGEYWELILESPIIGHGTGFDLGSRGGEGAHNMYLTLWFQNGLLGILIYLLLVAKMFQHFYLLNNKQGMIYSFVFMCNGFFTHNLLHDRSVIVLLGILASLAYLEKSKEISSQNFNQTSALN